ncbi:MAG: permease-like cell division protein FtsX [Patescibacteria group bacterium]
MRSILRTIKFAFQSIFRNFWLSFVTTSVFLLTLITVNAVVFMNVVGQSTISSIESRVHVDVYLKKGTSQDTQAAIRGYLTGLAQVKQVIAVPADEALIDFKAKHAGDADILAALDEIGSNPLGDTLRVSSRSPADIPFILQAVNTPEFSPHIEETGQADYEDVVRSLTALSDKVRYGGLIVAGFFAMIALLMVFNTVRVAIYVHRDEIAVMRLVGAHDWFIRAPFLIEGVVYSLVATAVVAGLMYGLLKVWQPAINAFFAGVDLNLLGFFYSKGPILFLLEFLTLSFLSMATSFMAMRKYLKI